MKETTRTSRTAGYLEKIFRALNNDSFGGELEEPIITIQSTPTAYGHITVAKTWKRKDDWRHELNISADWLERPIENVVATMIHEMTHLYNIQHNVQDCSRGGTYHNKKFKEEAEKHMIHIEKDEKYGWTRTARSSQRRATAEDTSARGAKPSSGPRKTFTSFAETATWILN